MTRAHNHSLQLFHKVVCTFQTLYLFPRFEDFSNYQTCCGNPEALSGIFEGFVKPEQSHPLKSFYLLPIFSFFTLFHCFSHPLFMQRELSVRYARAYCHLSFFGSVARW